MMRFLLGFFVAALVFVPDQTINFVGAVAVTADTLAAGVTQVTTDTLARTEAELRRRNLVE